MIPRWLAGLPPDAEENRELARRALTRPPRPWWDRPSAAEVEASEREERRREREENR